MSLRIWHSRIHHLRLKHHPLTYLSRPASTTTDVISGLHKNDDCLKSSYDCVIIGAGHNGLTAAAYLQKAGVKTCVLERRPMIGGAAVTEEIIPGYKFSRASYLLSLLRPQVFTDLQLKKYGLKLLFRDPNSYTPILEPGDGPKSLTLGSDTQKNTQQIAQFSTKDAKILKHIRHNAYHGPLSNLLGAGFPRMQRLGSLAQAWFLPKYE